MGISDWFRSRPTPSPIDDLRSALLDAFGRKDYGHVMGLINDNRERIKGEFRSWTTVPEAFRADADALNHYGNTLMTIARLFEESGDAALRIWLEGGNGDNPLTHWNEALQRARQLTETGLFAEAIDLLRATLNDIGPATGTGVDHYRARCLGTLGMALSKQGDTAGAVRVTREALEICRQVGDEDGVKVYVHNLDVIGSCQFGDRSGGQRFTVVLRDSNGHTLLPEELSEATGTCTWEIRDAKPAHPEAKRLHEEGRAAGGTGNHDAAIVLFTKAAALDPSWPYPVYDRAFAHLHKHEFDAALADYRKTLELSPLGFFTAAVAADMLTREAAGEFPAGLHAAFALLEHMPADQQRQIVRQLVEQCPSHAPAWQQHASFLEVPSDRLAAIECGLLARPDPVTRGSLLVQKALTLHAIGERESALDIVDALASGVGDSLDTYAKACIARAAMGAGESGPAAGGAQAVS